MENQRQQINLSLGLIHFLLLILILRAWFWGLPTSWGVLHIDIFPPGVYLK